MSKCEICTKMFKSNNHLQQHLKTHSDEKHYSCNLCSKSFKWDSSLNTHIQAAHNPSGPAFKCDQCDKCFSDRNNLKKHLYVHSDIKPYICSFCKKGTGILINLRCCYIFCFRFYQKDPT